MPQMTDRLAIALQECDLSVRARNILRNHGIRTVGDLIQKSADDLLNERCYGERILREIREFLGGLGLALRGDDPPLPTRDTLGVGDWFSRFARRPRAYLGWPTWVLDLCPRTQEWLDLRLVPSVRDLLGHSEADLRRVGLVDGTPAEEMEGHLDELRTRLGAFGLALAHDAPPEPGAPPASEARLVAAPAPPEMAIAPLVLSA